METSMELEVVKTKAKEVLRMKFLLNGIILLCIFQGMQVECQNLK